jgi:hypothetical protein
MCVVFLLHEYAHLKMLFHAVEGILVTAGMDVCIDNIRQAVFF